MLLEYDYYVIVSESLTNNVEPWNTNNKIFVKVPFKKFCFLNTTVETSSIQSSINNRVEKQQGIYCNDNYKGCKMYLKGDDRWIMTKNPHVPQNLNLSVSFINAH